MKNIYSVISQKISSFAWLKFYVNYLFYSLLLLIPVSLLLMNEAPQLMVQLSKTDPINTTIINNDEYKLQNDVISKITVTNANWIQKIALPPQIRFLDLTDILITILILWQLKRTLQKINLNTPFKTQIYLCFRNIALIMLISFIIQILRGAYAQHFIKTLTHGNYRFWSEYFNPSYVYSRFVLLFFFIAFLFKKAESLQKEQDLTV